MNLSTMVVARVAQLPYIGEPQDKPIKRHEVVLTAIPIAEPKPDVVPLWVWVLSACVGVLILLLLIYLLYKVHIKHRHFRLMLIDMTFIFSNSVDSLNEIVHPIHKNDSR